MLQGGEIIIIGLLALVVLGPKRLPEVARKIGQYTAEIRKAARDLSQGLENEVEDLKKMGDELKAPLDEVSRPLKEVGEEVSRPLKEVGEEVTRDLKEATEDLPMPGSGYKWIGPKPVSGPTPEDAMQDLAAINRLSEGDEEE